MEVYKIVILCQDSILQKLLDNYRASQVINHLEKREEEGGWNLLWGKYEESYPHGYLGGVQQVLWKCRSKDFRHIVVEEEEIRVVADHGLGNSFCNVSYDNHKLWGELFPKGKE